MAGVDKGAGVPDGFAVIKAAAGGDAAALAVLTAAEDIASGVDGLVDALGKAADVAGMSDADRAALAAAVDVMLESVGGDGTPDDDDDDDDDPEFDEEIPVDSGNASPGAEDDENNGSTGSAAYKARLLDLRNLLQPPSADGAGKRAPRTTVSKEGSMPIDPAALAALPADVQGYIKSLEADVAKAAGEPKPDDVLKGVSPEVAALFKAQADRMAKAEADAADALAKAEREADARLTAEHVAKANTLGYVGDEASELAGEVRKAEARGDEATVTFLWKSAAARNAAFEEAGLFATIGSAAAGSTDANAELDTMAAAYAKEHAVPFSKAYAAVLETPEGAAAYHRMEG